MRKQTVVEHFGSEAKVAEALEISRAAVWKWPDIVPEGSAYKLQVITNGALQVDPTCYSKAPVLDASAA